jgi:hypothetical protein
MTASKHFSLAAFAFSAFGCAEATDIPDVPDLQALQRAYDEPSAALDSAVVSEVLEAFPALQPLAAAFSAAGPLIDRIEDARSTAGRRANSAIELRGSLSLNLPCPGHETEVAFNEALNGYFAVELAVRESQIRRTFWATARRCVLRGMIATVPLAVEIDGAFAFDVGADIPLRGTWQRGRTLIVADGTVTFDDFALRQVSARFGEGSFEYLYELSGGTVVLQLSGEGVSIRGRDGTWLCGEEITTCADD